MCELDPEILNDHCSLPATDPPMDVSFLNTIVSSDQPVNHSYFSLLEVETKLRSSEITDPGPDRLTYNPWKCRMLGF